MDSLVAKKERAKLVAKYNAIFKDQRWAYSDLLPHYSTDLLLFLDCDEAIREEVKTDDGNGTG